MCHRMMDRHDIDDPSARCNAANLHLVLRITTIKSPLYGNSFMRRRHMAKVYNIGKLKNSYH